jgi:hypothetical protein
MRPSNESQEKRRETTPSQTPDGKDLPIAHVVGDEGGAGISAGGEPSAKSGAGLGRTARTPKSPSEDDDEPS